MDQDLIQQKQLYLRTHILEGGYDVSLFTDFIKAFSPADDASIMDFSLHQLQDIVGRFVTQQNEQNQQNLEKQESSEEFDDFQENQNVESSRNPFDQ